MLGGAAEARIEANGGSARVRVQASGVVAIDGTLDIGLERVSQSCGSCDGLSVSCPPGKKLLVVGATSGRSNSSWHVSQATKRPSAATPAVR